MISGLSFSLCQLDSIAVIYLNEDSHENKKKIKKGYLPLPPDKLLFHHSWPNKWGGKCFFFFSIKSLPAMRKSAECCVLRPSMDEMSKKKLSYKSNSLLIKRKSKLAKLEKCKMWRTHHFDTDFQYLLLFFCAQDGVVWLTKFEDWASAKTSNLGNLSSDLEGLLLQRQNSSKFSWNPK